MLKTQLRGAFRLGGDAGIPVLLQHDQSLTIWDSES